MMELTARDAVAAGVGGIVLVVGSGSAGADIADAVQSRMESAALRDGYAGLVPIAGVAQRLDDLPAGYALPIGRARPWGTGHAVWAARGALGWASPGGPHAVVVNADDWYGTDAIHRVVQWASAAKSPRASALLPYALGDTLPPVSGEPGVSRGIVEVDADARLRGLTEMLQVRRDPLDPRAALGREAPEKGRAEARIDLNSLCSMNLWALGPAVGPLLERGFSRFLDTHAGHPNAEWFLPDAVLAGVGAGQLDVRVLEPGRGHVGVTHPADRERARQELARAIAAR
jgi:hypothetical protein